MVGCCDIIHSSLTSCLRSKDHTPFVNRGMIKCEGDSTISQSLFKVHTHWKSAAVREGWRKPMKLESPDQLCSLLGQAASCFRVPISSLTFSKHLLFTKHRCEHWGDERARPHPCPSFPLLSVPILVSPKYEERVREGMVRNEKRVQGQLHLSLLQMLTSRINIQMALEGISAHSS
jgi:hypothetical protein